MGCPLNYELTSQIRSYNLKWFGLASVIIASPVAILQERTPDPGSQILFCLSIQCVLVKFQLQIHYHIFRSQVTTQKMSKRKRLTNEDNDEGEANFQVSQLSPAPFGDRQVVSKRPAMLLGKMFKTAMFGYGCNWGTYVLRGAVGAGKVEWVGRRDGEKGGSGIRRAIGRGCFWCEILFCDLYTLHIVSQTVLWRDEYIHGMSCYK